LLSGAIPRKQYRMMLEITAGAGKNAKKNAAAICPDIIWQGMRIIS
jgi:hypothetical protein